MTSITISDLIDLRDNEQLTVGETYSLSDYSGSIPIYMEANSTFTLNDESTTSDPNIKIHFDLDNGLVDYMKDTDRMIEGYFDWTSNVIGDCNNIYFENASNLTVKDSSYVYCEDTVGVNSIVQGSSNVTIGANATVNIDESSYIVVGGDSNFSSSSSSNVTVGERNNFSISAKNSISIADDNVDLTVSADSNFIGSRNDGVVVSGSSNLIKSGNVGVKIDGDLNTVEKTTNSLIGGAFNKITESSIIATSGTGNEVSDSNAINVVATNNCEIVTKDLYLENKSAFLSYKTTGGVKAVENIAQSVNMQSDNNGRTLIIKEEKFYDEGGSSGTKGDDKWKIQNGQWVVVN